MVTARNEKPPLPLSKIKDPLYPELLQVGVFLLLRELLTFHTIMNTTSHTRVSRGTKRLLVFFWFFYRLEGEEEGRAGQSEIF